MLYQLFAKKSGYIKSFENEKIGYISCELGAGRAKKEDKIDSKVGIIIKKKIGDKIENGDIIAYIHSNNLELGELAVQKFKKSYEISEEFVEKPKHILGIIYEKLT